MTPVDVILLYILLGIVSIFDELVEIFQLAQKIDKTKKFIVTVLLTIILFALALGIWPMFRIVRVLTKYSKK